MATFICMSAGFGASRLGHLIAKLIIFLYNVMYLQLPCCYLTDS